MRLGDYLWSLGPWNWLILALVLLVLETIISGVHFVWFGLAAVVVGIAAFIFDIPWEWQLIAFAIISCITVFFVRRFASPDTSRSDEPGLNARAEQYVGRVVTVEEAIAGGRGKVRVGDTVWAAQGTDAPKGAKVKVTGAHGTVLVVEHAVA
jgi:membrane protein implicated in regulation of membrane protease activity